MTVFLRRIALTFALLATVAAFTLDSASAKKLPPLTQTPSFLTAAAPGATPGVNQSPCTHACANGLQITWPAEQCVDKDRINPIIIVWTVNGRIPPNNWPVFASCSTGIQLTWGVKNKLTDASWIGSAKPHGGMTVCFGKNTFCSKSDCVTMGCLPKNTNGADIFFQGGDTLESAQWTMRGSVVGTAAPSGVSEVSWSGASPNSLSFPQSDASSQSVATAPSLRLLGRTRGNAPQTTTTSAPERVNGIAFKWFLSPPGPNKECIPGQGALWTYPPVAYEYTSGGALNAAVSVLQCPTDSYGNPIFFNGLNFVWGQDRAGSENRILSALPTYNGNPETYLPARLVPQPPANTDGVVFEFHHDDYQWTTWSRDGVALTNTVKAPGHTRMGTLHF